jgi:hypothetical protein
MSRAPPGAQAGPRAAGGGAAPNEAGLDWAAIDAQLARIPKDYFDPRFDSIKHVLSILGAVDSEVQVDQVRFLKVILFLKTPASTPPDHNPSLCLQLRRWKQSVEYLVDDVVEAHYTGFTRSLQNYTQILRLFADSRSQVRPLPCFHTCPLVSMAFW